MVDPRSRLQQAQEAFARAQQEFLATVVAEYPLESLVLVKHYHGQFLATVHCHCRFDVGYIYVQNTRTLKTSKRHFSDLEPAGKPAQGGGNGAQ